MSNGFRDRFPGDRYRRVFDEGPVRSSSFDNLFDQAFSRFPRPFFERDHDDFDRGDQRSSFSNRDFGRPNVPWSDARFGPPPSNVPPWARDRPHPYDDRDAPDGGTSGQPRNHYTEATYSTPSPREKTVKIEVERPSADNGRSRRYFGQNDQDRPREPERHSPQQPIPMPAPEPNPHNGIPIPMPPPEPKHQRNEPKQPDYVEAANNSSQSQKSRSQQQSAGPEPEPEVFKKEGNLCVIRLDASGGPEMQTKSEIAVDPSPPKSDPERRISRQVSINEVGDKIITMLDEIEKRVEKLRETAALLEDEKRQLMDMLNTVEQNKDMLTPSSAKEDIEAITGRLISRCSAVNVSVSTPRNQQQAAALAYVNQRVDDILRLMREDVGAAQNTCELYYNAACPDMPPGPIDSRFQSILIECTADDQKRVRKRLGQILELMRAPKVD